MKDRDAIRELLDSLPFTVREKVKAAGEKYRKAQPINTAELYFKVKEQIQKEEAKRPEMEKKRMEWLRQLVEAADKKIRRGEKVED